MRRQHTITAGASGLLHQGREGDPASALIQIDELAKPEMFSRLVDLAQSGRNDRGLDSCSGPTWTNVAHRALELMGWVLSEYGALLPSADLNRVLRVRAVGVNWVHGGDARSLGHDELNNAGIFEFETSRLRRAAWDLLQQRHDPGCLDEVSSFSALPPSVPSSSAPPWRSPPTPTSFDDASSVIPSANKKAVLSRMRPAARRSRESAAVPASPESSADAVPDLWASTCPASARPGMAPSAEADPAGSNSATDEREPLHLDEAEYEEISGGVEILEDAIAREQKMLRRYPTAAKPYRRLCEAYLEKGDVDAAFCAAQVLCFLGMAREQEQKLFEKYRPKGVLQVTGSLHEELWRTKLQHPDEDLELGRIFEMLADPALRLRIGLTKTPEPYGEAPEAQKHDARVCRVMVRMFAWAAAAFGMIAPRLLVSQSEATPLFVLASRESTSLVGLSGVSGKNPRELAFIVGRHLGGCRSGYGHRTRSLLPDVGLLAGLLGGAVRRIGSPIDPAAEGDESAPNQFSAGRLLGTAQIEALRPLMRSYARRGVPADIGRWVRAVQLTDCRAGYLLSGDLSAAANMIQSEQSPVGGLSAEECIEDLMAFSVSAEHLALRAALGAAVPVLR